MFKGVFNMKKYINNDSCQFFAFNIWNVESAKAVIDAAVEKNKSLILQTSMKAFEKMNKKCMRNFVTDYSSQFGVDVFLHLDHCKKNELFIQAIDNGWDSVMIDASDKSLEENIELTNKVSEIAHKNNVLVESEIGHIGGVEDGVSSTEAGVANINDVKRFLNNIDIDMLAVAIGTAHGLYEGLPYLHYDLLKQVEEFPEIPLVIHGGTGLTDEMFCKLLSYDNVKKINISTDVKLAYREGIVRSNSLNLFDEKKFDPLKITDNISDSIKKMAVNKLSLLEK